MLIDVQMFVVSWDRILIECRHRYFLLSLSLALLFFSFVFASLFPPSSSSRSFFFCLSYSFMATDCNMPCGYDRWCVRLCVPLFFSFHRLLGGIIELEFWNVTSIFLIWIIRVVFPLCFTSHWCVDMEME